MGQARTLQLPVEPLPSQGDLSSTPFPILLGQARAVRATGVLTVAGERFVFFLRGTPVHIDSLAAEETSEVYMRRQGTWLDEEELAGARAIALESGRGVGEALLGLGILDPNELFEIKRAHSRQKLVGCFVPTAGTIRFEPREGFGTEFVPMPVDALDAMREGLGRFYDRARLERELPVDDLCRVAIVSTAAPPGLSTEEARILKLAEQRPTVRTITGTGGTRSDDARRHLYALYCLGLVGFELGAPVVEETDAERRMQDPLPAPKAAGSPAASRPPPVPADAARARPSAPPPPRAPAVPPAAPRPSAAPPPPPAARRDPTGPTSTRRDPTGSVATRRDPTGPTKTSGGAPGSPAPRRDTTGSFRTQRRDGPTRSPDEALEASEITRAEGDLLSAIEILKNADEDHPGEPALQAQLAFLLVLLDPRKHAKEANRLAHEARKASPTLPMPYVVMGVLLEQIGQKQQAAQMYRHALARDPDCSDASRRLSLLEGTKR